MHTEIRIIQRLIPFVTDSVHGYQEAAMLVQEENEALAQLFRKRSHERERLLATLRHQLLSLDRRVLRDIDGTLNGNLHQVFMRFRSLFQKDSQAALAEIEYGETILIKAFEQAIEETRSEFKQILEKSLQTIRTHEHTIDELRKDTDVT